MTPQQARQVLQFAAEHIQQWKSRLKINTGNGVEAWDTKTGQMVSVSAPQETVVTPVKVLQPILWANTRRVSVFQEYAPPGSTAPPPTTVEEATGWYAIRSLSSGLTAGQSVPPRTSDAYKNPDALTESATYPGYFSPTHDPIIALAPDGSSTHWVSRPQQVITEGALAGELYGTAETPQITTVVTISLSIRGYTAEYISDRERRGLSIEFERGVSVGNYDVTLRKEDDTAGPVIGTGEDAVVMPMRSVLSVETHRIGLPPSTFTFNSVPDQLFGSPGIIGVMSYRKV